MKVIFRLFPLLLISQTLIGTSPSLAADPAGFDFLRTLVGARPSAMGGSFVAVPGDIYGILYNPAGLSSMPKRQATLTYLNHLLDFQSVFVAYGQPLTSGTMAFGLNYFDYGTFEGRDENNADTGEFGASSFVLSASYSRMLSERLSLGGSAKFIRFQIESFSETALAGDLGLLYSIPTSDLHFALAVFNVGTATSAFIETKDDLPLNVQFGVSKKLEHLPLMVSGALIKFNNESLDFRLGGEFTLTEQLFLRVGYNSVGQDQKVDTSKDRLAGVSFGLGLKVSKFDVDYSFSSFGEVGSLNRITLIGRF